jgi:hypothetical protein
LPSGGFSAFANSTASIAAAIILAISSSTSMFTTPFRYALSLQGDLFDLTWLTCYDVHFDCVKGRHLAAVPPVQPPADFAHNSGLCHFD